MSRSPRARIPAPWPALVLLLAGCPSSIRIVTDPPGARVIVDGQDLGHAPVTYGDIAPVGTRHSVEVYLDGYQARYVTFSRNGPLQPAAICAGALCILPFAWAQGYPRQLTLRLMPAPDGADAEGRAVPPASDDPLDRPPYPGWTPPAPPRPDAPPAPDAATGDAEKDATRLDDDLPPPPPPPPESERRPAREDAPAPL